MISIIEKVKNNLEKNGMNVIITQKKDDVVPLISSMLKEGDNVSCGGSVTLSECGVNEFLHNGKFNFYDAYVKGLTDSEKQQIYIKGYGCDFYFTGTNAITEDGTLYNVDGRANRVSAIAYGPKKVIVVAGVNKIVSGLDAAVERVKKIAAPKNCVRLGLKTYCAAKGVCEAYKETDGCQEMACGCKSSERICCNYLISGAQRIKGRITVILVNEELGY